MSDRMHSVVPLVLKRKVLSEDIGGLLLRGAVGQLEVSGLDTLYNPRHIDAVSTAEVSQGLVVTRLENLYSGLVVLIEHALNGFRNPFGLALDRGLFTEDKGPELNGR